MMVLHAAYFVMCDSHVVVHLKGAHLFHIHKVILSSDEVGVADMADMAIHLIKMLE